MTLPPNEPMRTGGGGVVMEVLTCLTVVGAATLAFLAAALEPGRKTLQDDTKTLSTDERPRAKRAG